MIQEKTACQSEDRQIVGDQQKILDSLQNARKKTGSDPKGVALPAFLL